MKNLAVILIGLCAAQMAFAQSARKYPGPKCAPVRKSIVEPANSAGYFFNEDCSTAYVLPPIKGKISVAAYIPVDTAGTCSAIMGRVDELTEEISAINRKKARIRETRYNPETDARVVRKQADCDKISKQASKDIEFHSTVENLVTSKKAQLAENEKKREQCNTTSKPAFCSRLERDIRNLEKEIYNLESSLGDLVTLKRVSEQAETRCEAELNDLKTKIAAQNTAAKTEIDELDQQLQEAQQDIEDIRAQFDGQPGGELTMSFLSGVNDLVKEFKNKNPNVDFAPMPLDSAVASFSWVQNGQKANLPITLKAKIEGLQTDNGTGSIAELLTNGETNGNVHFGQAVSGKLVMTRLAQCRLAHELGGQTDNRSVAKKFAALFLPTITYNYSVQVDRKVAIKYNESHLYQLIKKHSSKGGLFSSKSSASVTEKSEAQKWLQVRILSDDKDHQYANAEAYEMDIRREYLDSALMKVARSYTTAAPMEAGAPGQTGAEVGADALRKCPHLYCQVGAVVLDLGSALFGRKTSESSMTRIVSAMDETTLINSKMVDEFGTQSFEIGE